MVSKKSALALKKTDITFEGLISSIRKANDFFSTQANRSINISLTLRNWLIGFYVSEFELRGQNRAAYGEGLLSELSKKLTSVKVSNCDKRQLYRYLKLFRLYPQIGGTVSPQFTKGTPSSPALKKVGTVSPQSGASAEQLVSRLSYSQLELLIEIDDTSKRGFYETKCLEGQWSVRDLKRQIASLYFERTGLSKDKKKLTSMAQKQAEGVEAKLDIRDPYVFEFLGLKAKEVMAESNLEEALLLKLQEFLLELGHGFCFEASQRRILIDGKHYFVDLVFYHRILKCHVLIELKVDEFNHHHLGQLNTYVNWFEKNAKEPGDNPPVGILLCTKKDHALAEYALAGMNNKLFVSKYQVELPKKKEMENFLETTLKEIE